MPKGRRSIADKVRGGKSITQQMIEAKEERISFAKGVRTDVRNSMGNKGVLRGGKSDTKRQAIFDSTKGISKVNKQRRADINRMKRRPGLTEATRGRSKAPSTPVRVVSEDADMTTRNTSFLNAARRQRR